MKLVAFTVKNYRSITDGYKLPLGDFAVLVGPNNEGKSNVLRAIVLALNLLSRSKYYRAQRQLRYTYSDREERESVAYDWGRDYPVQLQTNKPDGRSEFTLEFELSTDEQTVFKKAVKVNLSTNLRVRLTFGKEEAKLDLVLQGPAKTEFLKRHDLDVYLQAIAKFISERFDIQYIPAVRTARIAERVVDDLLSVELAQLNTDPEYKDLLVQIEKKQRPILDALQQVLTETIGGFVPEVKAVGLRTKSNSPYEMSQSVRVYIDDGTETELAFKGDGVKSLAAISLLRHVRQRGIGSRAQVLAIEEPESHLHPQAVHRLRVVMQEIAKTHQVILTTHSPVLVDRRYPERNIIVQRGKAFAAKHIRQVREALGVEIADNLMTASLMLLVEGENDELVLRKWLAQLSSTIDNAMENGNLAIDKLGRASTLSYKTKMHKANVCQVHAFMDNDQAGKEAVSKALDSGALELTEIHETTCAGLSIAEFEDLIAEDAYTQVLAEDLGIAFKPEIMRSKNGAWSDRMKKNCIAQGRSWTKDLEARIKSIVAREAARHGLKSLNPSRRGPVDALVLALEKRLSKT
jgi:predicted ATP-dependent endonuclease of OLD family